MARAATPCPSPTDQLRAWLAADVHLRPCLRDALADALGDVSLQLWFWAPHAGHHVNDAGVLVALPGPGGSRAAVDVTVDDRRVGAIVYDATLIVEHGAVRAAGRVVATAIDLERVSAELRATREALRVSRARLLKAADDERRRIARDLHDGLQARLVLLAMRADHARAVLPSSTVARDDVAEVHVGLQEAIADLRALVHGVMPAALMERGLNAAAQELTSNVAIPVDLDLDRHASRLPGTVESTGYFVVSEALANAVKHSGATELHVCLGRDRERLRIEVRDDGIGGAHINGAGGMRWMDDRVTALGGRLFVHSPAGGGTRVIAEVPCGS